MKNNYKLPDFIKQYKEQDLSFPMLHFKEIIEKEDNTKLVVISESILDKYDAILKDIIVTRTLTTEEFNKYQYNPKLLSYDMYGTVELWSLLLYVNQLHSTSQFSINPIKVYNYKILSIIESIMNLEKPIIDENEEYIIRELKK